MKRTNATRFDSMKENEKIIAAFIAGAVIGGAIAWFLTSDKKEEMISDLKSTADRVKKEFGEVIDKGRKVMEDFAVNNNEK